MMRSFIFILILMFPVNAYANGSPSGDAPPKPTKTTKYCTGGKIWDPKSKRCINPKHSSLDDERRYKAVREFAYHDQYENSLKVLRTMANQTSSRVLTYYGFNNRKAGRFDEGMKYYNAALNADPSNLLVRSYMGQGFVEKGDLNAARLQLAEIVARGGQDKWPEISLRQAIKRGKGYNY